MEFSFEAYFGVNFLMDALILALAARGRVRLRPWRIIAAAALCAAYAVFAAASGSRFLSSPAALVTVLFLGVMCAIGTKRLQDDLSGFLRACANAFILGGAQLLAIRLMPSRFPVALLLGAALGVLTILWVFSVRSKQIACRELDVLLRDGCRETRVSAIVDTGNRLREPLSELPVLIVSSRALPRDFGSGLSCRSVRYGALGGGGTMRCYRPDAVLIDTGRGRRPAPDVWVAVYPGAMPGMVQALAPACMAARQV